MHGRGFLLASLKAYAAGMAALSLMRVAFLAAHLEAGWRASAVARAVAVGALIDSSALSLLMIAALLVSLAAAGRPALARLLFALVLALGLSLFLALDTVDIFFFRAYGVRTNALALGLAEDFGVVAPMLRRAFPLLRVSALALAMAAAAALLARRLFLRPGWASERPGLPWIAAFFGVFALLSGLYYPLPFWHLTNIADAAALNQGASNGPYSLVKSVAQERVLRRDVPAFDFLLREDAAAEFRRLIGSPGDVFLSGSHPTLRRRAEQRPAARRNVAVIIEEGFGAKYVGSLNGGRRGRSPRFDALAREGVLFSRCLANGPRTQHALASIVGSFPAVLGASVIRRKGLQEFQTLGNILAREGYRTVFLTGGDASYDHMDVFLRQGGFQEIYDEDSFGGWRFRNEWGVSDEDLFDKALQVCWAPDRPTLSVIMTTSHHAPYDLPDDFAGSHPRAAALPPVEASFRYADRALGEFMRACARREEYEDTLFLVLADHGERWEAGDDEMSIFHVPALLLNTGRPPGVVDTVCSQADFGPTILGELGYRGPSHLAGRDLFAPGPGGFALTRGYDDVVYFWEGGGVLGLEVNSGRLRRFEPRWGGSLRPAGAAGPESAATEKSLKACLQTLSWLYRSGSYRSDR